MNREQKRKKYVLGKWKMKQFGLLLYNKDYFFCLCEVIIFSNSSSYGFFLVVPLGCSLALANNLCESTMCSKFLGLVSGKYVGRVLKSVSFGCRGMLLDSEFAVCCKKKVTRCHYIMRARNQLLFS